MESTETLESIFLASSTIVLNRFVFPLGGASIAFPIASLKVLASRRLITAPVALREEAPP